jgi:hypothetical protein
MKGIPKFTKSVLGLKNIGIVLPHNIVITRKVKMEVASA